jgi:integrase
MSNLARPISERAMAQIRVSKATFPFIEDNPTVWQWTNTIANEGTRLLYAYRLMLMLKELDMTPDSFLSAMKASPDDVGKQLDGLLVGMKGRQAAITSAAIKKFAKFHRIRGFELTYEVKARRVREKRPLPWDDALRIIKECPTPYREVFQFMLYGALDESTFTWINWNEKINNGKGAIDEIKTQMDNDKPYVKINLPPRKVNLDRYFILVPKAYVPTLPALTGSNRGAGKGGVLLAPRNMQEVWQHAADDVGLYYQGLGPHKLRTAFRSKCADLGIPAVGEWQMGHGGEEYGYDLSGMDENFILDGPLENGIRKGGLRQLWADTPLIDRHTMRAELAERDKTMAGMKDTMRYLTECRISEIEKEITQLDLNDVDDNTSETKARIRDERAEYTAELEKLRALLKGV